MIMSDIAITPYQPEDAPAIINLVRELQAHESEIFDRAKSPDQIGQWYLDSLLKQCDDSEGQILVARSADGSVVGYASILARQNSADYEGEIYYEFGYVSDLAVAASLRGQGIGSQLLDACEQYAKARGAKWLRIQALTDNTGAVRLYEKFGFRSLSIDMEKVITD